MTNLLAAVFWLIAALINTGGDDALSSLPRASELYRDMPGLLGVDGVVEPELLVSVSIEEQGLETEEGFLDVLPALRTATVYSIPVHGLSNDGTVIPPTPTPTLVATMEAESPKEVACEWECILRSVGWPEYAIPAALSVSWCESRWQDVQNFSGGNFWGRFQISPYWHADKLLARGYPATGYALLNPWVNAEIALMIWSGSGWSQWECKP